MQHSSHCPPSRSSIFSPCGWGSLPDTVPFRLAGLVAELAQAFVYVEQGRSGKAGVNPRLLFDQTKRDAEARKFDRLLVWKVSRLGRDGNGEPPSAWQNEFQSTRPRPR